MLPLSEAMKTLWAWWGGIEMCNSSSRLDHARVQVGFIISGQGHYPNSQPGSTLELKCYRQCLNQWDCGSWLVRWPHNFRLWNGFQLVGTCIGWWKDGRLYQTLSVVISITWWSVWWKGMEGRSACLYLILQACERNSVIHMHWILCESRRSLYRIECIHFSEYWLNAWVTHGLNCKSTLCW